jgi:DNA repair exonuclease SbcCD ATPase subunit
MLNPTFKSSPQGWQNLGKQLLLTSSSVLSICLALSTVFSPSGLKEKTEQNLFSENSTEHLAIGLGSVYVVSSLIVSKRQDRKIRQLENSKQQATQQLHEKEEQFAQFQTTLKQNYQQMETFFMDKNEKLVQIKDSLEQQLHEKEEQIVQSQTTLKQQKQAYKELEDNYQQMEDFFTKENDKLVQAKKNMEQDFKKQEDNYLQEFEHLEKTNKQLEQEGVQIKEQINRLNQKLETVKDSPNNAPNSLPDLNHLKIALVGGHPQACNEVKNILKNKYKLKQCNLVPCEPDKTRIRKTIKEKTQDADFIFLIPGYSKHTLSKHIYKLQNTGSLQGKVINLGRNRGSNGIVYNILEAI